MTCIVGLTEQNKVYIGGDSASGNGSVVRLSAVPKVFSTDGFLIGYTSSWRMGQILEHHLLIDKAVLPKVGNSLQEFMVRVFVENVRELLKTFGYAKLENNEETGGAFLVGYCGHLYHIESDYQVNETINGMDACGAGEEYALGALYATRDMTIDPFQRISTALEAAAQFCPTVRPPFIVKVIGD